MSSYNVKKMSWTDFFFSLVTITLESVEDASPLSANDLV